MTILNRLVVNQVLADNQLSLEDLAKELKNETCIALDTETTGLDFEDRLFSIQLAGQSGAYYLNFYEYEGMEHATLDREAYKRLLSPIFLNPKIRWIIHNAKFDLLQLKKEGIELAGTVVCTMAVERLLNNKYASYSLDACLKRRGRAKNDMVKQWITDNKAYTMVHVPGKLKKIKKMHFERVPFDLMFEYGCQDVNDAYFLAIDQMLALGKINTLLVENEYKLTKVCHDMEWEGIQVDVDYAKRGLEYENKIKKKEIATLEAYVGGSYESGPIWLKGIFDARGIKYKCDSETGNPIFDKGALGSVQDPIARCIESIRHHEKYANTYYASFLALADKNNTIRAAIQQSGTDTGRLSYWEPNLQNVPKEDKGIHEFYVRKCFVPNTNKLFVMLDYDQMEYRVMADYAGESALIAKIKEGEDVHQATASLMGVERTQAKTINFMLLYGGGAAKLAAALGIPEGHAKQLKDLYFSKLPKIKQFIYRVQDTGRARGYILNKYGRQYRYEGPSELKDGRVIDFAYKLPNYLIQGTCADVMRFAMVRIGELLKGTRSRMVISVHDELVFEFHKDELELVSQIKNIMENIYEPFNGIKLTCGVEFSWKSWGRCDIIEGSPI